MCMLYLERELSLPARKVEQPLLCERFKGNFVPIVKLGAKGAEVDSDVLG